MLRWLVGIVVAVAFILPAQAQQEWGDLKIQFVYDGKPPAQKMIPVTQCGVIKEVPDESLVVNAKNGGIANIIAFAYEDERRGGVELPAVHPSHEKPQAKTLANEECRFVPRVVCMTPADTLTVTNPDAAPHNAKFEFFEFKNKSVNVLLPPSKSAVIPIAVPESVPIPVECNLHPQMRGFVSINRHRYATASDAQGIVTIKDLPVGNIAIRFNHQTLKFPKVKVAGKAIDRRSVLKLTIKPGMNDLGKISLK